MTDPTLLARADRIMSGWPPTTSWVRVQDTIRDLVTELRALSDRLDAACDILDAHAEICSRSGAWNVLKGHAARLRAATADSALPPERLDAAHSVIRKLARHSTGRLMRADEHEMWTDAEAAAIRAAIGDDRRPDPHPEGR